MVRLAARKLTNGEPFEHYKIDHVFAVLSQRLCIEPVLVGSEAVALANRSVAQHMRLITGISTDRRIFYTYSPSEPILVLGAVNILYNTDDDKRLATGAKETVGRELARRASHIADHPLLHWKAFS